MRIAMLFAPAAALVAAAVFAPLALHAQAFHAPDYLIGGGIPSPGTETQGLHRFDFTGSAPVLTKLLQPGMQCRCVMDRDNRHVLLSVQGSTSSNTLYQGVRSGLYRFDPATLTVTTVVRPAESPVTGYSSFYHTEIDHNGDYISGVWVNDLQVGSNRGYRLWKVSYFGRITPVLTTASLGRTADFSGKISRDIQTGLMLISDQTVRTSPTTIHYPILALDTVNGKVTTYNDGGAYGWYGFYNMPQNYRTGDIEGPYGTRVIRVTRGGGSRTTVTTIPGLPYPIYGGGAYDLQTAHNPRIVCMGYQNTPPVTWHYRVDAQTWTVTAFQILSSVKTDSLVFDFYRGRHTQSVLNGKQRWDIYLSAPQFPNRAYLAAVGASGVWPGIKIPDGRRILLNLDNVAILSAQDQLRPYFNPGPAVLDAGGNAKAHLNLSAFPRFGVPCWVSWVVFDRAAPSGIAYIPDPYVIRI